MMSVATLVIGMGLVLTVLGAVISLSKSNKHNVKTCPGCKNQIPPNQKSCPYCGYILK